MFRFGLAYVLALLALRNDALALSRLVCLAAGSLRAASSPQGLSGSPLSAAGRSPLQKWCLAAATQPPALFVGYRLPMPLARWRCTFGGGWACPPPMPPCPSLRSAPRHGGILITLAAAGSRRSVAAPTYAASCARGPRPALVRLGGPPPLLAVPAPYGRAPPGSAGLRESGARYARGFFFGYRVGGRRRRLGALNAPPRPRRRGAPCSLWSRCAPSPPRPLRPLPSGAGVRYATRRPLWSRPRRRRRPPSRTRRSI